MFLESRLLAGRINDPVPRDAIRLIVGEFALLQIGPLGRRKDFHGKVNGTIHQFIAVSIEMCLEKKHEIGRVDQGVVFIENQVVVEKYRPEIRVVYPATDYFTKEVNRVVV